MHGSIVLTANRGRYRICVNHDNHQKSPEDVRRAGHRLLETVQECGHRRFVHSPGCTLAVQTPPEYLHAMFQTAREFSVTRTRESVIKGGFCYGR